VIQVIPDILTSAEAQDLMDMTPKNQSINSFSNKIVQKVANTYQSKIKDRTFILEGPSYWRVENRPKGHKWHYDGCKDSGGELVDNHMPWCRIGTTALLTPHDQFTGGELSFKQAGKEFQIKDHYLNGVMYSAGKDDNPSMHKVEKHSGKRTVLLMFFATNPVSKDQLKGN